MNFHCTRSSFGDDQYDLNKNDIGNGWQLFLDDGWTEQSGVFYKGIGSSWCRIHTDTHVHIETNQLRDFPIYHDDDSVSNFIKLQHDVPVDGVVHVDGKIRIEFQKDFYPEKSEDPLSFQECHKILFDTLIENVSSFDTQNNRPVLIPVQNGIDTLTVRSVFDHLGVKYQTFDLCDRPKFSRLGEKLFDENWGFKQVMEASGSVIVTGFHGDEYVLRNPYYVNALLHDRGVDLLDAIQKTGDSYMTKYILSYGRTLEKYKNIDHDKLLSMICNDFQIWHLNDTYFFSPLKDVRLLGLLNADNQTVLSQITNAGLSRSIIERCNPKLMGLIDAEKNHTDPSWFDNPEYLKLTQNKI